VTAEYEPTDDQRALGENAAAFGLTQADIAEQLKIDEKTLRKHFKDELSGGKFKVDMLAGKTVTELMRSRARVPILTPVLSMAYQMKKCLVWCRDFRCLERDDIWPNRKGDSRIGGFLIQPAGWEEAGMDGKTLFYGPA
jgi:AraC-like DNA-binding protein